jgi:site-specific DNA-methyltransferase (adenine-specific)
MSDNTSTSPKPELSVENHTEVRSHPYYQHAGITIYHGDCRDILPMLGENELILTSPPYDSLRNYTGCTWDWDTFEKISNLIPGSLVSGGVLVWIVNDQTVNGSETGTSFRQALQFMKVGMNMHDTMIYEKDACPFPATTRYYPGFEFMFVFSKGKPRVVNLLSDKKNARRGESLSGTTQREKDGKTRPISASRVDPGRVIKEFSIRSNVWRYSAGYMKSAKEDYVFEHPAVYPEALARDHILSWSSPGDTVVDCFAGSGTTLLMAKQLGRKGIGIEIEERYCEIAAKRLRQDVFDWESPKTTEGDTETCDHLFSTPESE